MTCEHYWREGILRAERGERDPHRETCNDCRRAHQMREQLIRALPDVGRRATGDPHWQARVWSRIAREETARARRSYWISGAVAACALVVVCVAWMARMASESAGMIARPDVGSAARTGVQSATARGDADASRDAEALSGQIATLDGGRPRLEIIKGKLLVRGAMSAAVHDRIRYAVPPHSEVRMYRADRLVLRCLAREAAPGCTPDAQGLIAEAELATAGDYQLIVISSVTAEPVGTLDGDLAAVVAAGGDYKVTELSVR